MSIPKKHLDFAENQDNANASEAEVANNKLETELTDIYNYYHSVGNNHVHSEETAEGQTDDKTPEDPTQIKRLNALDTDARGVANQLFSKSKPISPARNLAFADLYDTSQSYSRINKLYNMTRSDFYKQAKQDLAARALRINKKRSEVLSVIKLDESTRQSTGNFA